MSRPHRRLVIVCDHPSLHRGFSVVGERIAHHLHRRDGMTVEFIGRYPPAPGWRRPGYAVHDLHDAHASMDADGNDPALVERFRHELAPRDGVTSTVLCIGNWKDLRVTQAALETSGRRQEARLLGYLPVDYAPLPVPFARFGLGFDGIVPYSTFASDAIAECCARAGVDPVSLRSPIPHGVDTSTFHPLPADERRRVRAAGFGVDDDTLLIGYFGRNLGHKRPDLVLRLLQLYLQGAYVICSRCGATTGDALRADGRPGDASDRCAACESTAVNRGRPAANALLYLHTDLHADEDARFAPQARDLLYIAGRYGIGDRLRFDEGIRIGRGVPVEELARRMAACDLHVLPYVCAGWELTVLETGACGVANIITDIATPPQYAAPFSAVIPVATDLIEDEVNGLIDMDLALRALLRLAGSPEERRRLGEAGVLAARGLDWQQVCERWAALVEG